MKVLILYRPHSEEGRGVNEFVQNLERSYPGSSVSLLDADSVEGTQQAELYDVMRYPAILALAEDGSLLNSWVGDHLPLADDVAGYLRS